MSDVNENPVPTPSPVVDESDPEAVPGVYDEVVPQVDTSTDYESVPDHQPESTREYDVEKSNRDLTQVARDVMAGNYGEGDEQRQALVDAGFNPLEVKDEILRLGREESESD